jgi:hypothetical protein
MAFSPDGELLASVPGDKIVKPWNYHKIINNQTRREAVPHQLQLSLANRLVERGLEYPVLLSVDLAFNKKRGRSPPQCERQRESHET